MTRTHILTTSALAALAAALAVATGAARADDGPQITAGTGCAVQCVKKAVVTATASSAKVEIDTTVTASVTVTVKPHPPAHTDEDLTLAQMKTVHLAVPGGLTRTAFFLGLKPDSTYDIWVKATDLEGRSSTRAGTFETLPVKTNGIGGPGGIDSGLGCSVQCITKALFTQAPPDGAVANAELKTSTNARIQLIVAADQAFHEIVFDQTNPWLVRSWKPQVRKLLPGMTYHVVVRATDAQGRISERRGTFNTVRATALVTVQKIKIINDGDTGKAKGELFFRYFFAGDEWTSNGWFKLRSGQVASAKARGTSRPGVFYRFSANGDPQLQVGVTAEECDGVIFKNCRVEASSSDRWESVNLSGQHTRVGGTFRLKDILSGALPGWYGTGVSQLPGHDAYFVFGPADDYVKIQVLATVDLDYEWPS